MKILLPLFILVSTIIFLVQNQQPVVLYFLGTNAQTALFTIQLPIGIWVVLFTAAGILTSLILQFLNRSSPATTRKPLNPPPRQKPPKTPSSESSSSESSEELDWGKMPQTNWEGTVPETIDEEDDWNIEEPPIKPTVPREQRQSRSPLDDRGNFERQQPPSKVSRQGSMYSYTYRELSDEKEEIPSPQSSPTKEPKPGKNKADNQIYDANYRIITPPYREPEDSSDPKQDQEDEDWL
ncbi:MAG TPA: hypothetical protein DCF68_10180 [Cyanothece sp. UBA12306]|nr:hypothetical protein [Cyanothece sp. UBA12306]